MEITVCARAVDGNYFEETFSTLGAAQEFITTIDHEGADITMTVVAHGEQLYALLDLLN